MKLAEIMQLALRQLDEDPADVSDYDDVFRRYANEGYQIVMRDIYKPRERLTITTDKTGAAKIDELGVVRIVELHGRDGREVRFDLDLDGRTIYTRAREQDLEAIAEMECPMLERDLDEPAFPAWAHSCLADYICYRHLSSGNLAKQSRAQFYLNIFYQNARRIRPQGTGSVTRMRNLYAVTDARYVR